MKKTKKWQRSIAFGIFSLVLLGMSTMEVAAADENHISVKNSEAVRCETIQIRKPGEKLPWPQYSWLPVEGVPVTQMGAFWIQGRESKSYRAWIYNATSQTMRVTIRSFPDPINYPEGSYNAFTISAGENVSVSVNNAVPGYHFISMITPTGDLDGMIRVREAMSEL